MYIHFTNTSDDVGTCVRNASVSNELICSNQQAKYFVTTYIFSNCKKKIIKWYVRKRNVCVDLKVPVRTQCVCDEVRKQNICD